MRTLLVTTLILASCATVPQPRRDRFDVAVRGYFFAGFRGDEESLAIGMKKCEERLAGHPDDAEALVWHGAGLTFQSGAAFRRGDRAAGIELYQRGIAEVDRARALAPTNVGVLIPRAAMYTAMTMFMPDSPDTRGLLQKGVADYEETLRLQRDHFAKLSTHARGQLFYGLADGYSRLGDAGRARSYYQRLLAEVPDSPLAPRASDWLAGRPRNDKVTCIGCHAD
jgi:tetratricopeptide (TPR) repeat protein